MGLRFRKSLRLLPGVRLNFSKSGVSASIGHAPFTVNLSSRGLMTTASLPGTGISFRNQSGAIRQILPSQARPLDLPPQADLPPNAEIQSAAPDEVTSEGLAAFLKLLQEANEERRAIKSALADAEDEESRLTTRYEKRRSGFLLKRLFPSQTSRFKDEADEATASVHELREQCQRATIQTEIQVPEGLVQAYAKVRDAFQALLQARAIWDVTSEREVDVRRERSSSTRAISRERVRFEYGRSDILSYPDEVPVLRNRNGGDLFLYPAFILVAESPTTFGLVDFRDLRIAYRAVRFTESEEVQSDAAKVGTTWLKVNADGSPDKRFRENRELPVVAYGSLELRSGSGLNEEYQVSNEKLAGDFGTALKNLIAAAEAELGPNLATPGSTEPQRGPQAAMPKALEDCGHVVQELLRTKPKGWEYLIFAEVLQDCIHACSQQEDPVGQGAIEAPNESMDRIGMTLEKVQSFATRIVSLVNQDLGEALGPPGQSGNAEALFRVAHSLGQCYLEMTEIISSLRSMNARTYFEPIRASLSRTVEGFQAQVRSLPDQVRQCVLGTTEAAELGQFGEAKLSLVLDADPDLNASMRIATSGARQEMGLPPE